MFIYTAVITTIMYQRKGRCPKRDTLRMKSAACLIQNGTPDTGGTLVS